MGMQGTSGYAEVKNNPAVTPQSSDERFFPGLRSWAFQLELSNQEVRSPFAASVHGQTL